MFRAANTEYMMNAKDTLLQFVRLVEPKLDAYWNTELGKQFGYGKKQQALIRRMVSHAQEHNLRPAKRIRGAFTYYAYMLGHDTVDSRIWNPVMALELVQTALLIHDDVMDQDKMRRGKPTTHLMFEGGDRHYGESMAYAIGDFVLTMGYQLLIDARYDPTLVNRATSKLLRGIVNTAFGQAYDITLEKQKGEWSENDVLNLHRAKTAIYTYDNPLAVGAILAGLDDETLGVLHDYSTDGGVCFQLQDDVLGVFGDPKKTGKSANSDLLQGKRTLLIQKTLERGTEAQQKTIEKIWGKRTADASDIDAAKHVIVDTGSLDYSVAVSRKLAKKAVNTAEKLRKMNLNSEAIDFIQGVAQYMVERDL